jgi:hypothetical protein
MRRYRLALQAIKQGSADRDQVSAAEWALSDLRSELYVSPRGRQIHGRLEQQLSEAIGAAREMASEERRR